MPRDVLPDRQYAGESLLRYLFRCQIFSAAVARLLHSIAATQSRSVRCRTSARRLRTMASTDRRSPLPFAQQFPHRWAALSRSESPACAPK